MNCLPSSPANNHKFPGQQYPFWSENQKNPTRRFVEPGRRWIPVRTHRRPGSMNLRRTSSSAVPEVVELHPHRVIANPSPVSYFWPFSIGSRDCPRLRSPPLMPGRGQSADSSAGPRHCGETEAKRGQRESQATHDAARRPECSTSNRPSDDLIWKSFRGA